MRLFFYGFLIIICFSTCQQSTQMKETVTGFIANPQILEKQDVPTLTIGEKAPDFNLPATDGKMYALSDFDAYDILAIIFTCNHCPTAQAYEERIKQVVKDYAGQSFKLIAISPNSPLGVLYEELGYSDLGDSYEDGQIRHEEADFNFTYLYDGDDHAASLQYGPVATPHTFVFGKDRTLAYVGRIDKSEKPGTANAEDLRSAIDALLANQPIENTTTKTFGCSTKWAWKSSWAKDQEAAWKEKPVSLTDLDEAGVKALIANTETDKLRLVNVWATWCAPCRIEYPEFVVLHRMFGARDFEFMSLSADAIAKRSKALSFLEDTYSALPNFIFPSDDKYALIEAVDRDWNGALPYTMLIEPGGKVVWKHQGEVDFQELKKVIVEHDMIGRVY